jgi:hypothetical protein
MLVLLSGVVMLFVVAPRKETKSEVRLEAEKVRRVA